MLEEGTVLGLPFAKKINGMARIAIPFDDLKQCSFETPQRSTTQIELSPGTGVIVVTPFKVQVTL
jgi:hypothetical protein